MRVVAQDWPFVRLIINYFIHRNFGDSLDSSSCHWNNERNEQNLSLADMETFFCFVFVFIINNFLISLRVSPAAAVRCYTDLEKTKVSLSIIFLSILCRVSFFPPFLFSGSTSQTMKCCNFLFSLRYSCLHEDCKVSNDPLWRPSLYWKTSGKNYISFGGFNFFLPS